MSYGIALSALQYNKKLGKAAYDYYGVVFPFSGSRTKRA